MVAPNSGIIRSLLFHSWNAGKFFSQVSVMSRLPLWESHHRSKIWLDLPSLQKRPKGKVLSPGPTLLSSVPHCQLKLYFVILKMKSLLNYRRIQNLLLPIFFLKTDMKNDLLRDPKSDYFGRFSIIWSARNTFKLRKKHYDKVFFFVLGQKIHIENISCCSSFIVTWHLYSWQSYVQYAVCCKPAVKSLPSKDLQATDEENIRTFLLYYLHVFWLRSLCFWVSLLFFKNVFPFIFVLSW